MWFFHLNFLQKSHSEIRLLLTTCASLNCSHAKQIREDLDELEQQAKTTPATGNRRTLPQRDREIARKWQKRVWVWCLRLVVLSLCNHAKPYFLAWWLLAAQAKGPFQDSKELKMNSRIVIFQERLSTLGIRCIKSDKLRQTKCNDVSIEKTSTGFITSTYRKPTHTGLYSKWSSFVPLHNVM